MMFCMAALNPGYLADCNVTDGFFNCLQKTCVCVQITIFEASAMGQVLKHINIVTEIS